VIPPGTFAASTIVSNSTVESIVSYLCGDSFTLPLINILGYNLARRKQVLVQAHNWGLMAYSNKITVYLLTRNPRAKDPLHVALANMRDEPEEIAAFAKRWGSNATDPDLEDSPAWPCTGVEALPRWANLRAVRNVLRDAWRGKRSVRGMGIVFASIQVTGERIEVSPGNLVQTAFLLFMRDHLEGRTAICENPECPTPYFIRKRKTQKACDGGHDCSDYGYRLRALKWWRAHGEEWRSKRKSKKK
jgi:hypothetical protein